MPARPPARSAIRRRQSRLRRWLRLWAALPLLACAFASAAPTPVAAPLPTPTAIAIPFAGIPQPTPAAIPYTLPRFADYREPPLSRRQTPADYSLAFDNLTNPALLSRLNAPAQVVLSRQGFVVTPVAWPHLYQIYQRARENGDPIFVSSDAIIALTRTLLTAAAQRAEQNYLAADLLALSQGMTSTAQMQAQSAANGDVQAAAHRNAALFSVGGRLLDPAFAVPAEVAELVNDELLLIASPGAFISPLSGVLRDYGGYHPPAYYAADPQLTAYFQARLWYQQAVFDLAQPDVRQLRQQARQLLLLGRGLDASQNWARWERVATTQAYLAGTPPQDVTLRHLQSAAQAVYGGWPPPSALADTARLDNFIATARAAVAHANAIPWLTRPQTTATRLFPALLFNRVGGYEGPPGVVPFTSVATPIGLVRGLPHGLDLAAVLGSSRALAVLQEGGDTHYQGFAAQLQALQTETAAWSEEEWTDDLSGAWLYALQPLLLPANAANPVFMRASAWEDKQLAAWLAGWILGEAELTWTAAAPFTPTTPLLADTPALAYLEPQPALYARLEALAQQMQQGLAQRDLLDKEMGEKLLRLEQLLGMCRQIAQKELASVASLTTAETALLLDFGDAYQQLVAFADGRAAPPLPLLLDAYTDANTGRTLQLGLGEAWQIYAIVPINGQPTLAVGGVFSVYQSGAAAGEELDSGDWLLLSPRPNPAPWLQSYVTPWSSQ
ncbi:MAG: DUF3160 domain-containing protein [Candidatus Promineifilaceae bacterium]